MIKLDTPNQSGLTIVELIVVMSVSFAMIGLVTGFALNFWGNTVSLSNSQNTLVSRLNASDYLHKSIGQATGFVNQNDIQDNNTGAPDPAIVSGKYWVPVHAIPGLIPIGAAGSTQPVFYYRQPSINTTKNIAMNGKIPYEDNVILYMDGTTKQLRSRVLANTSAPANQARTTCPPVTVTASCPADRVIADDVTGVNLRYFSRSGNLIDYSSITDPVTMKYSGPDYPSVEIVELTVKLFRKAQLYRAADTTTQVVIRVALRN